jgi:hypothetical protein
MVGSCGLAAARIYNDVEPPSVSDTSMRKSELPRTPYMRSSQTSHLSRVGEAPTSAVVATDSASVNANYDNGTTLQRTPRPRRRDDSATHRVGTGQGSAAGVDIPASFRPSQTSDS